jgi:hypothetical protein
MAYEVQFPIGALGTIENRRWKVPGFPGIESLLNPETSQLSLGPSVGFDPDWYIANVMAKNNRGTVLSKPRPLTVAEKNSDPNADY